MLRGENIIIFAGGDWETPRPTAPEHLTINFVEENRVLYIETFGSRLPSLEPEHKRRIVQRFKNWFKGIRKQYIKNGEFYIYSPITLMVNLKPLLFINRLIFLNILKRLIKKLDMENAILFFYLPPPPGVIGRLKNKAIIYHCIDEWSTYPGGKNKIFMDAERRLIEDADLVLAANELLYERKKPYARRIHKIYHGVDYGHFASEFRKDLPLPEDIRNIPRPIIAVIGSFTDWIDLDLIRLISKRHKEYSVISIGPVDSNVDIRGLINMGNIYFLGQKNYSELPNYYRAIDVFIVPFLLNEHIKYSAPTRLYEHLSSGKPVITTDFPAAHEVGQGLIDIASDRESFVKKIEKALEEKDASLIEKRKALARQNTWKLRTEEISEKIEEILKRQ